MIRAADAVPVGGGFGEACNASGMSMVCRLAASCPT
jgi:hypothetical protein